ncbi:MAG: polyprenol phosphomannose-dependent alpha 1,6 mannosyltransferase MptB, partial [Solirubrobacterales bacterium]
MESSARATVSPAYRWGPRILLTCFGLVSLWLAAAPAVAQSQIVLATVGGSPDWLLGVFRFAGAQALAGSDAGWIYYCVLMAAMLLYAALVWQAKALTLRLVWTAVIGIHVVFLLAPPLLSQDVFSYIAYSRLGVVHDLNPYAYRPFDIPQDPVFGFAGSKDAVNVYGPFFALLTYPLAWLPVAAAFWVLKSLAMTASLALIYVVARIAEKIDVDPRRAVVIIGLCPATLVHVVGGAHNEALVMLIVFAGIAVSLGVFGAARAGTGGFVSSLAIGVKASAAVPLPFMLVAARERSRM